MNDLDAVLKQLNAILGVVGSFVHTDEGTIVTQLTPRYTDEQAQRVARIAHQALRTLEASGVRLTDLDLTFGQGYVVLKNLRGGVLGIVCARNVNMPLVHLNVNLAAKKLSDVLQPRAPTTRRKSEPAITSAATTEGISFLELEAEWQRIMRQAIPAQIALRVMGELGTWLCCPRARHLLTFAPPRHLIFGALAAQRSALQHLCTALGYQTSSPVEGFASAPRWQWFHPQRRLTLTVHFDTFSMYHTFDLVPFLTLEDAPLPETALFLSRLQFVEMSNDIRRELGALLLQHEISARDEPGKIQLPVITRLCADDWGWYKTATMNLQRLMVFALKTFAADEKTLIIERASRLVQAIEDVPKSPRWQTRAQLGESTPWYNLPPSQP